jgi:hypothetical protein
MTAKKRAKGKSVKKKRLDDRGSGIIPTPAQKKSVKDSLGAIKNDVKDIELRIDRVLDTLDSVDFIDD